MLYPNRLPASKIDWDGSICLIDHSVSKKGLQQLRNVKTTRSFDFSLEIGRYLFSELCSGDGKGTGSKSC